MKAAVILKEQSEDEEAGAKLIDELTASFSLIAEFPRMGRTRSDLRQRMRCHAVPPYVVFYRTARDHIVVMRIVHKREDLKRIFPPGRRGR